MPESAQIWLEVIGYAGMAFVLIAYFMKDMVWLRIIALVGSLLSGIYGFATQTLPTAILNLALLVINAAALIIHFVKKSKAKKKEAEPLPEPEPAEETKEE